jgi:hypothetical protein
MAQSKIRKRTNQLQDAAVDEDPQAIDSEPVESTRGPVSLKPSGPKTSTPSSSGFQTVLFVLASLITASMILYQVRTLPFKR